MLSWLTGSRPAELAKEWEDEGLIDDTRFEAPETPAPVFAVRAFKHAIFGTPQPPPTVAPTRHSKIRKETRRQEDAFSHAKIEFVNVESAKVVDNSKLGLSPTKQGILLTPGTVRGRKKEVTFGAQVVDNEGKKAGRSGLPSSYPGKFPSPWTPKIADATEEKKRKPKLTEALYEAKATGTTPKDKKPRAKDDADITIDIMEPRSESGRYWKEQYMSYSEKSEHEVKKLIAKQKLARDYARKKDEEASDLRRQLESEKKRRHTREKSLERQVKDLRERLRQALAENAGSCTEIAMLKHQAETGSAKVNSQPVVVENPQSPELPDFLWSDACANEEEENPRMTIPIRQLSVVQGSGEQARPSQSYRERRLARKAAAINRQDSVVAIDQEIIIPEDPEPENTQLEELHRIPTPHPSEETLTPVRRTLVERSANTANILPSSPPPVLASPSDLENLFPTSPTPNSKTLRRRAQVLDSSAPMEALNLQAEQPVTPHPPMRETWREKQSVTPSVPSSRKHKRSEAKIDIPDDRVAAAKARVAARKKAKGNSRIS